MNGEDKRQESIIEVKLVLTHKGFVLIINMWLHEMASIQVVSASVAIKVM